MTKTSFSTKVSSTSSRTIVLFMEEIPLRLSLSFSVIHLLARNRRKVGDLQK